MKDKKFKLLLVSALSIGQAFSMDMSELDDKLGDLIGNKKSVVPSLGDSTVSGSGKKGSNKKPIWSSTKTKTEFNSKFMLNIPGRDPFEVHIDNNNSLARGTDLVEAYLEDVSNYDKLTKNLKANIQSYNNKIQAIDKNKDLYTPMFISHINTKYNSFLESEKDILTKSSDVINKEKIAIQDHVDNISKATGNIFKKMVGYDKSDYPTILSNLKSINDKLEPLYKHYQKLEAAVSEVSEALNIFDEEAAANKLRAAALKGNKAAKEAAAKAEAELKLKQAEVEAMKIDAIIQKENDLRDRTNNVKNKLLQLVQTIENNSDKYTDEFVNKITARIKQRVDELVNKFDQSIKSVNTIITMMKMLDDQYNKAKSEEYSELGKASELLMNYERYYKEVSTLFNTSENVYNDLLAVYNDIQAAALKARVVDPKAIAATLDLARAVRVRQVAMAPRVLELAYAVRHK